MQKRLYRSHSDRMLFGVCGGMAQYFDIDPVIIRLAFVLLGLTGAGIVFYIIAAIIIPEEPVKGESKSGHNSKIGEEAQKVAAEVKAEIAKHGNGVTSEDIFGLILIALGVLFLIQVFFDWFKVGQLWPVIIILLGILVLFRGRERG